MPVCVWYISAMMPASAPEMTKASAITRVALTPSIRAILKSSAAARISTPIGVRLRKIVSRMSRIQVTATITSCRIGTCTLSESGITPVSSGQRPTALGRPL